MNFIIFCWLTGNTRLVSNFQVIFQTCVFLLLDICTVCKKDKIDFIKIAHIINERLFLYNFCENCTNFRHRFFWKPRTERNFVFCKRTGSDC